MFWLLYYCLLRIIIVEFTTLLCMEFGSLTAVCAHAESHAVQFKLY